MTCGIDQVRNAIQLQLEPLQREAAELEGRLSVIQENRKKLEVALKALAETRSTKANRARKPARPCAKKDKVLEVCREIVGGQGPLAKAELEELAKSQLTELGYSLSGVQLRLRECLTSKAFQVTGEGLVALADSNAPKADHESPTIQAKQP